MEVADVDLVEWTAVSRARIEPSRRRGNGRASAIGREAAERLVCAGIEHQASCFVNGLFRATSTTRALTEAVLSPLIPGAAPVGPTPVVDAVRYAMLCNAIACLPEGGGASVGPHSEGLEDALLFLWHEAGGLTLSVDAVMAALDYELVLDGERFNLRELSVRYRPGARGDSWEHTPVFDVRRRVVDLN